MKTLRVGFSSHKFSAFSWLIRTVTKSTVSHAYVVLPSGNVFQASGLKVNEQAWELFEKKARDIRLYDVTVSDEQYDEAMGMTVTEVGKPYSVAQIFGFVWVLGMRQLARRKVPNPFGNGGFAYVCVELVADMMGLEEEAEGMTPEDLRRYCERNAFRVQ